MLSFIHAKMLPNKPDRANRRQLLGLRERVGEAGVRGLTAAVAHPGRSAASTYQGQDREVSRPREIFDRK